MKLEANAVLLKANEPLPGVNPYGPFGGWPLFQVDRTTEQQKDIRADINRIAEEVRLFCNEQAQERIRAEYRYQALLAKLVDLQRKGEELVALNDALVRQQTENQRLLQKEVYLELKVSRLQQRVLQVREQLQAERGEGQGALDQGSEHSG